jgi:hypothetical protein
LFAAVVPWTLASAIATVTLNAALAPRFEEPRLPQVLPPGPAAPAAPPAQLHNRDNDEVFFDPNELISV